MRVNVNLFKTTGKWAYGGEVTIREHNPHWSISHKLDILRAQNFVGNSAFQDHVVVVTHRDDYDTSPSTYFCQRMYPPGAFSAAVKFLQENE